MWCKTPVALIGRTCEGFRNREIGTVQWYSCTALQYDCPEFILGSLTRYHVKNCPVHTVRPTGPNRAIGMTADSGPSICNSTTVQTPRGLLPAIGPGTRGFAQLALIFDVSSLAPASEPRPPIATAWRQSTVLRATGCP